MHENINVIFDATKHEYVIAKRSEASTGAADWSGSTKGEPWSSASHIWMALTCLYF